MSIIELGALGEFVGAIAVVITLIYLAVQLRQNTASVRNNSYQAWASGLSACFLTVCRNDNLSSAMNKGFQDSRNLTEDNWIQFLLWHQALLHTTESTYLMYKSGSIDESVLNHELERAAAILRFPGTRQWWESGGKAQVSAEFSAVLEKKLSEIGRFGTAWWTKTDGFHVDPSSRTEYRHMDN